MKKETINHSIIKYLDTLLKREYMRGMIGRSNGKYTLESLERRCREYRKDNPNVKKELVAFIKKLELK